MGHSLPVSHRIRLSGNIVTVSLTSYKSWGKVSDENAAEQLDVTHSLLFIIRQSGKNIAVSLTSYGSWWECLAEGSNLCDLQAISYKMWCDEGAWLKLKCHSLAISQKMRCDETA